MKNHYDDAAKDLKLQGITLGAINGPMNPRLMRQFGVRGYPTQITFYKGKKCKVFYSRTKAYIVQ